MTGNLLIGLCRWIFFLQLWALTALSPAANGKTISIATGDYAPYAGETLPHQGIGLRIIREAYASQGIRVEYRFFPWIRAMNNVRNGEFDASGVWFKTSKREREFLFSVPVFETKQVLFHLKRKHFEWHNMADLSAFRIGATQGYSYGESFDVAERDGTIELHRVSNDVMNFRKLLTERIDIVPVSREVGYYLLSRKFSEDEQQQITHHPRPTRKTSPLHLIFRKDSSSQHWIDSFAQGMRTIEANGVLQSILTGSTSQMRTPPKQ